MSFERKTHEGFDTSVLPDLSPFVIEPDDITTTHETGKSGQPFDYYYIKARPVRSPIHTFVVRCFKREADRLRALAYTMAENQAINAVLKASNTPDGFDQVVFSITAVKYAGEKAVP